MRNKQSIINSLDIFKLILNYLSLNTTVKHEPNKSLDFFFIKFAYLY